MTDPTTDPRLPPEDPYRPAQTAPARRHGDDDGREWDLMGRASWGAIFAGAVIAIAFVILFDLLGLAIGFLGIDPLEGGGVFSTLGWIWAILASVLALIAGGVVAGRLSGAPTLATAAAHGAAVWAISTVATLALSIYAAGAIVSGAASALSSASSAVAQAGQAVVPEEIDWPEFELPEVTMDALPPEIQQTLREQGVTPEQLRRDAREIAEEIVSEEERDQIRRELISAAQSVIGNPSEIDRIAEETFVELVGPQGVISEEDLQEAQAEIETRFGVTPEQAERVLEGWATEIQAATEEAETALREAGEQVEQAIDQATGALSAAAWVAFFASAFGFGGAVAGAAAGRPGAEREEHEKRHRRPVARV